MFGVSLCSCVVHETVWTYESGSLRLTSEALFNHNLLHFKASSLGEPGAYGFGYNTGAMPPTDPSEVTD